MIWIFDYTSDEGGRFFGEGETAEEAWVNVQRQCGMIDADEEPEPLDELEYNYRRLTLDDVEDMRDLAVKFQEIRSWAADVVDRYGGARDFPSCPVELD